MKPLRHRIIIGHIARLAGEICFLLPCVTVKVFYFQSSCTLFRHRLSSKAVSVYLRFEFVVFVEKIKSKSKKQTNKRNKTNKMKRIYKAVVV